MKCAQDGLLPDGREAALVTFKDTVQYMPMVAGILKKVRNSGDLATIGAHVVYENDTFSYTLGDDERIDHKPLLVGDRGKPVLTYAIAKTKDGGIYREVMTEAQIQAVRNVSRARDNGPWSGPFADEMRRKTAIRRLSKRLPMSTDADELLRHDDEWLGMETAPAAQTDAPANDQPKPRRKRMQDIVDAETQPAPSTDDIIDVEDVL
jgi:recombination protein RecT